jgi:acetyl esterase/lipase
MSDIAPGRLGDPASSLGTDPRTDPRLATALAAFGLDVLAAEPPLTVTSPREDLLGFIAAAEEGFEALFGAALAGVDPVAGVDRKTLTVPGTAGHEITLHVHKPAGATGPLPCIVHLHGGGMVLLEAGGAAYTRWRDELAASGLVVVGVEFRNGGGAQGVHPYPAGPDDCADAVRWVHAHLGELGGSHIVVSGESGGGNLTLATAVRANREGWIGEIAGLYAQCPYVHDPRDSATALTSARENDGYFISESMLVLLAEVYDPEGKNAQEATCWPAHAAAADLTGLPPTIISVNELDPLRDDGLAMYQRLIAAGVPAAARIVPGTCHAGDVIFRAALPEVYAATVRDISGFARSLGGQL